MIKISVPKETRKQEKRVAITPEVAGDLSKEGFNVMVETNAGIQAGFSDADYQRYGATIAQSKPQLYQNANVACWFKRPQEDEQEVQHIAPQATLIGFLDPLKPGSHMKSYTDKQITPFSWELLPAHPKLKKMDAFAEMGKLAGKVAYQNALVTAKAQDKQDKQLTVLVIGTGNAGLSAATSASVKAAKLVVASTNDESQTFVEDTLKGAFIKLSNCHQSSQQTLLEQQRVQLSDIIRQYQPDIIITTARRYGVAAPVLLTEETLALLQPGTIIEDLTASVGGNTVYTQMDRSIETKNGVLIRNRSNYPSQVPAEASQLYATCLSRLLQMIKSDRANDFRETLVGDPLLSKAVWMQRENTYHQ